MIELRPYQTEAVDRIREAFRNGASSVLYQLPTGGGKSAIFNHIAASIARNGRSAAVIVHRDELIQQNCRALELQEIPHGVTAPGRSRNTAPVQVASVWTLARRLNQWPNFDLLVFDEAHHLPSKTFADVHAAYPNAYKLSVTATPARLDGLGLADFCDTLICGPTMEDLVEQGYLAPCEVYGPPTDVDLTKIHIRAGDYATNELAGAMDKPTITGSAVEHYQRLVAPRPAIAFCVTIEHCKHVADQFRQAGFAAESVDGTMDTRTRRARIEDLGAGRLNVLTSCQLLTEGVDTPICQAVIMLRPTQSLTLFLQMVGRAMRPKADGSAMLLLDHVKNCHRHGLPVAEREWTLEGHKRSARDRELAPGVRVCRGCYCVFPVTTRICPKCGLGVPKREYEIEEREGELVRLTPEQQRAMWRDEQRDPTVLAQTRPSGRTTDDWEDKLRKRLTRLARQKGYKDGWVDHIIDDKRRKLAAKQAAGAAQGTLAQGPSGAAQN